MIRLLYLPKPRFYIAHMQFIMKYNEIYTIYAIACKSFL